MNEKGEGIKEQIGSLQNNHGDVKYSIGNIANNTVITEWHHMGIRFTGMVT